ncbi:MAG: cytochrome C [Hyphomicrobiales bacterium]|nr:MAG: cytochrome C [Hyphomicrobiales bacterium]
MIKLVGLAAAGLALSFGTAGAQEVSVAFGEHLAVIGGCHDCHTVGYNESGGKVDPNVSLAGNPAGFEGPWGKTFAKNLRLTLANMSEDDWLLFSDTFETAPPMPWFNVHAFTDVESRSLYQYIKSLPGGLGEPMPDSLPPG